MNKKGRISLIVLSIIMFVVAIVAPLTVVLMNKNQEGSLTHPDWSVEDNVLAENFTFRYKLDAQKQPYYEVVEYKGSATDVKVPSSFRDVPVKTIAKNAFSGLVRSLNANIVSVQVPDSIISIGANAFNSCTSLKYINMHGQTNLFDSSVTIGANAFAACKSLETLTLTTDVVLGGNVWANNTSLRDVRVVVEEKAEANTILTKTFAQNFANASVATLTIDERVTNIEENAFADFSSITSLTLPATCEVGNGTFSNASITSIHFTTPEGVENVALNLHTFGNSYQNNKVENITLSQNITSIGANTFAGFISLKNINLENVVELESSAFANCASLTTLDLQKVTALGDSVFENCTALTYVAMPTLTTIPNRLFAGCVNLQGLTLSENLVDVGAGAFADTSIANVSISSGYVQESAFENAHIQNLTISNVANIASNAFTNATFDNVNIVVESGSVSAELLEQILTREENASQITNVSITKNKVSSIVHNSSRATNVQTLNTGEMVGAHIYQLTLDLSVIDTTNDATYQKIQAVLKSLTFEKLVLLNAPEDTITETIASYFTNSGVTSITFGEGVTKIAEGAFADDRAILELVEVAFTDDIQVADNAFNGCENLYKVTFNPEKLLLVTGLSFAGTNFRGEQIGDFMVLGNAIITYLGNDEHIVIPSSGVSSISAGAFAGKTITSIEIPAGIQISYGAFDASNVIERVVVLGAANGLSNIISYNLLEQFQNIKHLTVQNGVEYKGGSISENQLDTFTIEGNGVITETWVNAFGTNITKALAVSGYVTEIASGENYQAWGASLTEVVLGSRVQKIGGSVFAKANNIVTLNLQNASNLSEVGDKAFYNNAALTQVEFPTSVQKIGAYAFANASNLTTISGGTGLQTIGDGAFEGTAWYANQKDFVFFGGTLFQYKGSAETLEIGKQINISSNEDANYNVELKRIASGAFKNNTQLKTVTFTSDEIILGNAIFEGCTNLKEVTINITDGDHTWDKNLSNIFDKASVVTLIVGDATTKIVSTVLYNTNVQTLSLHAGITIPTINSFVSNLQLTNVFIRDGGANQVNEDFLRAVNNNKAVTTLVLGENVNVANNAFAILKTVTNVTISYPAVTENVFANSAVTHVTLTKRGENTIASNKSLLYLPTTLVSFTTKGITQLGEHVWMKQAETTDLSDYATIETGPSTTMPTLLGQYENLEFVTFDETMQTISAHALAFVGINAKTQTIRKNVQWVGVENIQTFASNSFACTVIDQLSLNKEQVYNIGEGAFSGTSILNEDVAFNANATYNVHAFAFAGLNMLYQNNPALPSLNIYLQGNFQPANGAENTQDVFTSCYINTLTFAENSSVFARMFYQSKIETLNLNNVTSMYKSAFESADVANFVLNDENALDLSSLTYVHSDAFKKVDNFQNLSTIIIGSALAVSGDTSFISHTVNLNVVKTNDVTEVNLTNVASTIENLTLQNGLTSIVKPTNTITYTAEGIVTFPENAFVIGDEVFQNAQCTNFVNTESITSIGNRAFEGYLGKAFTFGIALQNLGTKAFYNAVNLTSVDISSNVTIVNESAFDGCINLQNVHIENANTIADNAFYGCTSLKTFNSSEDGTLDFTNVTGTIGASAFDGASANTNIQTILLPHIQSVGGNAFAMFASATDLTIRNNASLVETSFTLLTQEGASGIINVNVTYEEGQETATVPFLTKLPITMQSITFAEGIITLGELLEITSFEEQDRLYPEFLALAADKGYQISEDNQVFSVMGKYTELSNVTLPNSLQNIGAGMFLMVDVTTFDFSQIQGPLDAPVKDLNINIPSNTKSISSYAFGFVRFGDLVFEVNDSLSLYLAAFNINSFKSITFTSGGVVNDYRGIIVGFGPEENEKLLTKLDLSGVTYKNNNGMYLYFFVEDVILPENLKEISDESFSGGNIHHINLENVEVLNSQVLSQNATIIDELNLTNLKTINDTNFQLKAKKIILGTQLHNVNITASEATAENIIYRATNAEDTIVNNFGTFMAPTITIDNGVTGIENAYLKNTCSKIQVVSLPTENTISIGNSIFNNNTATNFKIENVEQIVSVGEGVFFGVGFDSTTHATLNLPNCTYFGSGAFRNATGFTNVTFGTQITSIGSYAFASSSFDSNLDFSNNSVALTIGTNAFDVEGINVTSFTFANANITFKAGVFDIDALTTITIMGAEGHTDLTGITGLEFIKTSNVTSVILDDSITSLQNNIVGSGLFENMTNLVSVVANSITTVPNNTFKNCTSLQNFTFENVQYIGDSAFYNCTALNPTSNGELNLQNVVALGAQAFYGMKNITSVVFGAALNSEQVEGITITIGEFDGSTFEGTSVTTYDFSACSSLTTLKNFTNNTLVEEVNLSASIVNIADNAFDGCSSLQNINLDNVQNIGAYAFRNAVIQTVTMQELNTLGIGAFYNCQQLATVSMPSTLTVIPQDAFNTTTSLTTLTLPTQLTTIGASAFASSGVTNVNLPQTVTEIQANAFISSKLQNLSIYTGASLVVDSTAFNNTQQYTKLSVLYGSKEILDTNLFQAIVIPQLTEIEIGENITTIEEGLTFSGMSNLTTVTLTSVENIAEGLFTNTALQTLKVANYVTLHMGAFDAYTNTGKEYPTISFATTGTDITFVGSGEYTTKMAQCFANKTGLQSVTLQGFTAIASAEQVAPTFAGYVITNLYMPNVQSVGSYAFYETGLTNVFLPAVTNIGASAFESSSIQGIYENIAGSAGVVDVPNLATIEQKAFYDTTLTVLTNRNATVKSLADYAFSVLTQCGTEENALNFSGFTSLGVMELNASKVTFEASMTFNATWQEGVVLTQIAFNNSKTETVELPIAFVTGVGASVESVNFTGNLMNIPANMFTAFTNPAFTVINLKNINSVGANAFANLTNLATLSVYVHNVIDQTAFAGCTGVNNLYIDSATENGALTLAFAGSLHEDLRSAQTLTVGENITQIESFTSGATKFSVISNFFPTHLNILGAVQLSEDFDFISVPDRESGYSVAAINPTFLVDIKKLAGMRDYVIESIYAPNVYGALAIAIQVNELTISSAVTQLYVGKSVYLNNKIETIPYVKVGVQTIKLVDGDAYSSYNQENSYNIPYVQSFAVTSNENIVETVFIKQAQEAYVSDDCLKTIKTIGATENNNYVYNMPFVEKVAMIGYVENASGVEDIVNLSLNIPNAIRAQIAGMGSVNISSKINQFIENIEVTGNSSQEYIMQLTGLSITSVYTVNVVAWDEETQTTTVLPDVGNAEGVANFSSFSGNTFEMCLNMFSKKMILSPSFNAMRGQIMFSPTLQSIETAGDVAHNLLYTYNFNNITKLDNCVFTIYSAVALGTPVENIHLYLPNLVSYKEFGYFVESETNIINELTIGAKFLMETPYLGKDVAILPALQKLHIYNGVEPIQLNAGVGASFIDNIIATSIRPNITELTFEGNRMFIYAADSAENGVFAGLTGITELDLANVETIGAYAFANCTALTTVSAYLHNKLSTNAFVGCTSLTNLTIDNIQVNNGTIIIENNGSETLTITKEFADKYFITYDPETNLISTDKSKITSIQLLGGNIIIEGATSADLGVFANIPNLQSIDISGVTEIGAYAFANSTKLEVVNGLSHQNIDATSFENCPNVYIDGISYITFIEDTNTAKVNFLSNTSFSITSYKETLDSVLIERLGSNYKVELYFIGNNITFTDEYGINMWENLTKVYIGDDSVTTLPMYSFTGCGLTEVYIGRGLNSIGLLSLLMNVNLTLENIIVSEENTTYAIQYNCLIDKNTKTVVLGFAEQTLTEESDILVIGMNAFSGCLLLKEITIPNSVTEIQDGAFSGSAIEQIHISTNSQLQSIRDYAFDSCLLKSIYLPSTVSYIGSNAFSVSLKVITIDAQEIDYISNDAFRNCDALSVIINKSSMDFVAGSSNYGYIAYNAVYIGDGSDLQIENGHYIQPATQTYLKYVGLETDVEIPDGVINIADRAFYGDNIIKITLPQSLQSIGSKSFYLCDNLLMVVNYSSLIINKGASDNGYVGYYAEYVLSTEDNSLQLVDGVHWIDTTTQTYIKYAGTSAVVQLPENIQHIGERAFYQNFNIKEITIPATVNSIGSSAFYDCSNLQTIIFAEGSQLQTIGDSAFSSCSSLTEIVIPANVISIGSGAFRNCSRLQAITFAEGSQLQTIGNSAFYDCEELTSITIPAGVTSIGDSAFYGCNQLQTVTFAEGSQLQTIGNETFYYCQALTNIIIPAGVTSIGDSAFRYCKKIQTVTFAEGSQLQTIGDRLFCDCSSLTSITIPASVTSIGDYAFNGCYNIQTLTFAEGSQLQTIGNDAFYYCQALTSVIIPDSVTTIGSRAFSGCKKLQTVTITENSQLQTIDTSAFYGCALTGELYVPATVTTLFTGTTGHDLTIRIADGSLLTVLTNCIDITNSTNISIVFEGTAQITSIDQYLFQSNSALTSIVIPASVTSIGSAAFDNCRNLQTVTFAEGSQLRTIGSYAFRGTALVNITIPASVTNINSNAFCESPSLETITFEDNSQLQYLGEKSFQNCDNLSTVIWGENSILETISSNAFSNCLALKSISIPASVTNIQEYAFNACSNLQTLNIPTDSQLQRIYEYAFADCNLTGEVYIPSGCLLQSANIFTGHDLVLRIANESVHTFIPVSFVNSSNISIVFEGSSQITKIESEYLPDAITCLVLPNTIISIEKYAFQNGKALQTVSFAEGSQLQTIGDSAFSYCSSLTSIIIPENVTSIGTYAFNNCSKLQTVTFVEGSQLQTIGNYAFQYCSALTSITIPASVTSIGYIAFDGCSNLQTVAFAEGSQLQTIGNFAFSSCSALTSIIIPENVTSIGDSAFKSCSALTSIIIPASVTSIGESAFNSCTNLTSVTFADPNGWFVSTSSGATSGTSVTLTDVAQNATYLKSTYLYYYWKKSA